MTTKHKEYINNKSSADFSTKNQKKSSIPCH